MSKKRKSYVFRLYCVNVLSLELLKLCATGETVRIIIVLFTFLFTFMFYSHR